MNRKNILISAAIRHIKLKFLYVNNISTKEYIFNPNFPIGAAANGEEKTGEKLSELDKEKYLIQIRALGKKYKHVFIIKRVSIMNRYFNTWIFPCTLIK